MGHFRKVSSNVKDYSWDDGTMEIEYTNGKRYRYYRVPEKLFVAMRMSRSKGKFVNEHLKKPGYEYGEGIY